MTDMSEDLQSYKILTKTMETYDKVAETEDEDNPDKKLTPGPTPDNPVACLSPTINPSLHHSPKEKKPIVIPSTQQSAQPFWQQSKRKSQSMELQQEQKKKLSGHSCQSLQQKD